jgi:hypothetical protein
MMCKLGKNAVIFKVGNDIKDPIIVIQPQMFNKKEPDSCIPLLGIYNGTHYQSVFPASKKDEQLTVDIVKYFPEFQGNFKSFFKSKHEKLENAPVLATVQHNFETEEKNVGPNSSYDKTQATDDGLKNRKEETALKQENSEIQATEQENSEIQATDEGLNNRKEETALKQDNSENQATDDGLNNRKEETALEQENSEIQATDDGLNSRYEETVSEQENSEIQTADDGLNNMTEETALEQENSEIQATDDGLNSRYEETFSEQENSKIQPTDEGLNNRKEKTALEQENFKIQTTNDDEHLKHKDILSDFEEEAMLFMTMQEKKNEKLKKRARQRIRAQVI